MEKITYKVVATHPNKLSKLNGTHTFTVRPENWGVGATTYSAVSHEFGAGHFASTPFKAVEVLCADNGVSIIDAKIETEGCVDEAPCVAILPVEKVDAYKDSRGNLHSSMREAVDANIEAAFTAAISSEISDVVGLHKTPIKALRALVRGFVTKNPGLVILMADRGGEGLSDD